MTDKLSPGTTSNCVDDAKSGRGLGCIVLIIEEIVAKADTLARVTLSNWWSIILSNVRGMAVVADNVACMVEVEEDKVEREPLRVDAIDGMVATVAGKDCKDVN